MKFLFILCTCFLSIKSSGQQNRLNENNEQHIYATNTKILTLNLDSKDFIRILDGFELDENVAIPKNIKINSVWRLSDTLKLRKLGIKIFKKPYMLLSSFSSDTRSFIYRMAHVKFELQQLNLPIILNSKLITFDKYSLLDKLDTSRILKATYVKSNGIKYNNKMPLGMIDVVYK